MNFLQAAIISVIEGLTEFLPVSSTGHLIIAQKFLSLSTTEFTKTFDIVIQLAAILAVVFLFRQRLISSLKLWKQLIIAFIPTGIIGFVLYKLIRDILLTNYLITVVSLFVGGIILLLIDKSKKLNEGKNKISDLKNIPLINIGLFQSLSIIPGVSRSAASIVGGMFSGLSRSEAVEFSFLLAIPTIFAASGYDLLKSGLSFSTQEYSLLIFGCLLSFLSALIAVKYFIGYIQKHNFTVFAVYRILLAIIVLWIFKP